VLQSSEAFGGGGIRVSGAVEQLRSTTRVCRLALASVPASLLGNPLIVGNFRRWVAEYLPQRLQQDGEQGYVHWWFMVGCMGMASLVPLAALLREGLAGRRGIGLALAAGGFAVSLMWWGLFALILLSLGPGD
jgi:hypothetical protein